MVERFPASSGHPRLEITRVLEGLGASNICEESTVENSEVYSAGHARNLYNIKIMQYQMVDLDGNQLRRGQSYAIKVYIS